MITKENIKWAKDHPTWADKRPMNDEQTPDEWSASTSPHDPVKSSRQPGWDYYD